ncbi:hypothetical protein ACCO45_006075 [Purpureocillium lilacinum]|uniref:Uncharacterized protein n=1 Tax=Purpureocillium lilacinum TaxID=33203 RepID=A0ACC4DXZ2_PURLI
MRAVRVFAEASLVRPGPSQSCAHSQAIQGNRAQKTCQQTPSATIVGPPPMRGRHGLGNKGISRSLG